MTQHQIDERDRRWALALLSTGMSAEEAARMIGRPLDFIDGDCPAVEKDASPLPAAA